jgi:hypothetical protein
VKFYTLSDALEIWKQSSESRQSEANFEKYLKSALKRYVIPEIDPTAKNLKTKEFHDYCCNLAVSKLAHSLEIFDQVGNEAVEAGHLSKGAKNNYRSALARFLCWMRSQLWWNEKIVESVARYAPSHPGQTRRKGRRLVDGNPIGRKAGSAYRLQEEQITTNLAHQFSVFKQFRLSGGKKEIRLRRRQPGETVNFHKPFLEKVSESTAKREIENICFFLGWYVNVEGHSSSEAALELLTNIELLDDYNSWSVEERGNSHCTGLKMVESGIAIAKWLNYEKSCRRNWSDIPLVLDLRDLASEYTQIYESEKKKHVPEKWQHKELTHDEARQVVQYLFDWCAPGRKCYMETENGRQKVRSTSTRGTAAVLRSWQTYVIIKLLVYCPVRQQEIRSFELNKTLFRKVDVQGNPYYEVVLDTHKNFAKTGKKRHYKLPSCITCDLDAWIFTWRPIAENAVKSSEAWLKFWGHKLDRLDTLKEKLVKAKEGITSKLVKASNEQHIEYLEQKIKGLENRIAARETCKKNFESHSYVFFLAPNAEPKSFGKPTSIPSIWNLTTVAVSKATKALFGSERVFWTNPHAFRHIAEKHIRKIDGETKAFGTYIGHSEQMGDEYAEQITSEYEITHSVADNWWETD